MSVLPLINQARRAFEFDQIKSTPLLAIFSFIENNAPSCTTKPGDPAKKKQHTRINQQNQIQPNESKILIASTKSKRSLATSKMATKVYRLLNGDDVARNSLEEDTRSVWSVDYI